METLRPLCPRLLRGWVCDTELYRLLVLSPFWCESRYSRLYFLRCEHLGGNQCTRCISARVTIWSCKHDGVYSPSLQCSADCRAFDAETVAGCSCALSSV